MVKGKFEYISKMPFSGIFEVHIPTITSAKNIFNWLFIFACQWLTVKKSYSAAFIMQSTFSIIVLKLLNRYLYRPFPWPGLWIGTFKVSFFNNFFILVPFITIFEKYRSMWGFLQKYCYIEDNFGNSFYSKSPCMSHKFCF